MTPSPTVAQEWHCWAGDFPPKEVSTFSLWLCPTGSFFARVKLTSIQLTDRGGTERRETKVLIHKWASGISSDWSSERCVEERVFSFSWHDQKWCTQTKWMTAFEGKMCPGALDPTGGNSPDWVYGKEQWEKTDLLYRSAASFPHFACKCCHKKPLVFQEQWGWVFASLLPVTWSLFNQIDH